VEEDVLLAPRQETTVNARMTWRRPQDMPAMGMNETVKIPNLCRVYSGRNLLPARHTDLKVRLLNADSKEHILRKGTSLGPVSPVSMMETEVATVSEENNDGSSPVETPDEEKVVNELIQSLPDELQELLLYGAVPLRYCMKT